MSWLRVVIRSWLDKHEVVRDRLLTHPRVAQGWRAYTGYYDRNMHRTASAVTYFGVLTLFPFLGLVYMGAAELIQRDPKFLGKGRHTLQTSLGLSNQVVTELYSAQATASIRATMAVLGILGLTYAGWAWVDNFRQALRAIWGDDAAVPWWLRYARDWVTLLIALPALFLMVGLSVFVSQGPYRVLNDLTDYHLPFWARIPVQVLFLAATMALAAEICHQSYRRLGGAPAGRDVRIAAVVAGIGLGLMSVVAAIFLRKTLSDAYGIVVGILVLMFWVSASVRLTLAMAVWSATPAVSHRPAAGPAGQPADRTR